MAQLFATRTGQDCTLHRRHEWNRAPHSECFRAESGARAVGFVSSCQSPQRMQGAGMLPWLEIRTFSGKKSAPLSTNCQMPLKDLVLRRKEKKKVPFCFAEKNELASEHQVHSEKPVKSTNPSQRNGSSEFTVLLKTHPDSSGRAVYNLIY